MAENIVFSVVDVMDADKFLFKKMIDKGGCIK